jgi:glycine/D-amino acid oxidase-like deaminating enzyme
MIAAITDQSLPSRADVVIVGGGIAGCATAYYLAGHGREVVVLDKGALAYEQSSRNWGWVHQQVRYPHLIPLAMRAVEIWKGLSRELGTDVEWRQGGNLSIAYDSTDVAEFESIVADARDAGLEAVMLDREGVLTLLPDLAGPFVGGLHVPSDGQANPHLVTAAFARAAQDRGARVLEDCAVSGIVAAGDRVLGVVTERGTIAADTVIVAAGAWSARLVRPLGVKFPQRAVRASVVRTSPLPEVTALTAWGDHFTFRQDVEGRFVLAGGSVSIYDLDLDLVRDLRHFGPMAWKNRHWVRVRAGKRLFRDLASVVPGTGEHREFWQRRRAIDPVPNPNAATHTIAQLKKSFPTLEGVEMESTWAGYIDSTPDQAPVIGPAGRYRGLHILTGLSGHGFALGPAAAEMATDLIVGDEPRVDRSPFRIERFTEGELPKLRAYRR